jgi:hypothetical protein
MEKGLFDLDINIKIDDDKSNQPASIVLPTWKCTTKADNGCTTGSECMA